MPLAEFETHGIESHYTNPWQMWKTAGKTVAPWGGGGGMLDWVNFLSSHPAKII